MHIDRFCSKLLLVYDSSICISVAVKCQYPGFVQNSTWQLTGIGIGDKVKYSCNAGHLLMSGDLERVCLGTGQWNGTEPVCTRM